MISIFIDVIKVTVITFGLKFTTGSLKGNSYCPQIGTRAATVALPVAPLLGNVHILRQQLTVAEKGERGVKIFLTSKYLKIVVHG